MSQSLGFFAFAFSYSEYFSNSQTDMLSIYIFGYSV